MIVQWTIVMVFTDRPGEICPAFVQSTRCNDKAPQGLVRAPRGFYRQVFGEGSYSFVHNTGADTYESPMSSLASQKCAFCTVLTRGGLPKEPGG